MEKRRVVVTGLGAVTPIGNTVDEFWAGIKEGKVGIGPITKFDASDFKVKIAAEVRILLRRTVWMRRLPREWSHFHSMRWQLPKRHLTTPASIWRMRIRTESA